MAIIQKKLKGFSLLMSVLLMSIISTIAFSIFEIFYLQILMTGDTKDSQISFYAADTALECVYYNDLKTNRIKTGVAPICNNDTRAPLNLAGEDTWQLFFTAGTCVTIKTKFDNPIPFTTKIEAFGRNKYAGADCDTPVSRRVERGLEVEY